MAKIKIAGVIIPNGDKWIYDWFGVDATCVKDVDSVISSLKGEEVEIDISSGGGDVFAGSDIFTILKSYRGRKTVNITSIAASAASVIAMAGDVVNISPTAQIMIHNVACRASGDYRDMAHQSEVLKNYNTSIANAYRLKTKLSEEELLEMMNKETWLTAQQAKEKGFADNIMFDDGMKLVASASTQMIPQEVINKMRNSKENPNFRAADARLKLLRMRGEQR